MSTPRPKSRRQIAIVACAFLSLLGIWWWLKASTPVLQPPEFLADKSESPKTILYRGADAMGKDELARELERRLKGLEEPRLLPEDVAVGILETRAKESEHFARSLLRGNEIDLLPGRVFRRSEPAMAAANVLVDDLWGRDSELSSSLGISRDQLVRILADSWVGILDSRSDFEKLASRSDADPFMNYLQLKIASSEDEWRVAVEDSWKGLKEKKCTPLLRLLFAASRTDGYATLSTEIQGRDIEDGMDSIVECARIFDDAPAMEEFVFARFTRLIDSYNLHSLLFLLDRLEQEAKGSCSELFKDSLRAKIAEEIAFKYRGTSYAHLVEEKDMVEFTKWATIATKYYLKVLNKYPSLAPVSTALMRLERSAGVTGVSAEQWFRFVLSYDPEFLLAHWTFLSTRETKWGGGEAALLRYADQLHACFPDSPTLGLHAFEVLNEWCEEKGYGAVFDSERVKGICESAVRYLQSEQGRSDHWRLRASTVRILLRMLWDCGDFEGAQWVLVHHGKDLTPEFLIGVECDLPLVRDFCEAANEVTDESINWIELQRGLFFEETIRLSHPLIKVQSELSKLTRAAETSDSPQVKKIAKVCEKVFRWREAWETQGEVTLDFENDGIGWLVSGDSKINSSGAMEWNVRMDDASHFAVPRFRIGPPLQVEVDVFYDRSSLDLYGFAVFLGPMNLDTIEADGVLLRMIGTRKLGLLDTLPQPTGKLEGESFAEIPWNYKVTHKMILGVDRGKVTASIDGRNLPPVEKMLRPQGLFRLGRWAGYQARGDLSATGRYEIQKVRVIKSP